MYDVQEYDIFHIWKKFIRWQGPFKTEGDPKYEDNREQQLKGTLSPNKIFSYMKDITFLNIIHKLKILFEPSFSTKIADLAENVRLEVPEKQVIYYEIHSQFCY